MLEGLALVDAATMALVVIPAIVPAIAALPVMITAPGMTTLPAMIAAPGMTWTRVVIVTRLIDMAAMTVEIAMHVLPFRARKIAIGTI